MFSGLSAGPLNPKNWLVQPEDVDFHYNSLDDYIAEVDPNKKIDSSTILPFLYLCNCQRQTEEENNLGLALEMNDNKLFVKEVDKGNALYFLSKKSAFSFAEIDVGDQVMAINGVVKTLEEAEERIKSSKYLSIVVFKVNKPRKAPDAHRHTPGHKIEDPPHEDPQESFRWGPDLHYFNVSVQ